jgi:hypothetical protein
MSATDAAVPTPQPKRTYHPPRVRSDRVHPPDMFASGADGLKEPEEPSADPQPRP